jgi:hypothetical protein
MNESSKSTAHDLLKSGWCRLALLGVAVAAFAVFLYCEQNWGGKAAWLRHKRALEAKGEKLDWNTYIPAAIPPEQNIFAVPEMKDTFIKGGSARLIRPLNPGFITPQQPVLAELTIIVPGQPSPTNQPDLTLYYDAPGLSIATNRESEPPVSIPLIVMDEVPLTDAIANLARQAGIKYHLDPAILPWNGNPPALPSISIRWENVSARQALKEILKDYRLALMDGTAGRPARIIQQDPAKPKVFMDVETRKKICSVAGQALGPVTEARKQIILNGSQGYTFFREPIAATKPIRLLVYAETVPDRQELAAFFPTGIPGHTGNGNPFQIKAAGSNVFTATPSSTCFDAAAYLEWSDQFETAFDLFREALKRPSARMDGKYEKPFEMPIPNFVALRTVAQTLAQRAQCCFLLDQPDEALRQLTLLHDTRKLMIPAESSKAVTLVAAMINVAITGVYEDAIADGLRLRAWKEPQLRALEKQLAEVDLLPPVLQSLRTERAAMCRTLEMTPPGQLSSLLNFSSPKTFSQRIRDPQFWIFRTAPRGWLYDNMVTISSFHQSVLDIYDPKSGTIRPAEFERASKSFEKKLNHWSPSTFIAAIAVPNFTRAWQCAAANQDKARQALLACALERYHLTHNNYPERLALLVPEFLSELPADVITGKDFLYARKGEDRFLLYSVGWNEKDDGGVVTRQSGGGIDLFKGDWVWLPDQNGG